MIVRKAELADLNKCLLIDPSYKTEYVWQMYLEGGKPDTTVTFRTIKLPRPMQVNYPRDTDYLLENWQRGECFMVAEEEGEIWGYVDMTIQAWHQTGWINNLVVAKEHRRRGIGTVLLKAALRWAQERKLRCVMLESQTKNHPAICFFHKHGFVFCGFNDHYYANQDIALFFALSLV